MSINKPAKLTVADMNAVLAAPLNIDLERRPSQRSMDGAIKLRADPMQAKRP